MSAVVLADMLDQVDVALEALEEVERLVGRERMAGTVTGRKLREVMGRVREVRGRVDRGWRVVSDREMGVR